MLNPLEKDDGGPAFPMPSGDEPRIDRTTHYNEGMSLRDYAVVHFIAALIVNPRAHLNEFADYHARVRFAEAQADAMLEARKKRSALRRTRGRTHEHAAASRRGAPADGWPVDSKSTNAQPSASPPPGASVAPASGGEIGAGAAFSGFVGHQIGRHLPTWGGKMSNNWFREQALAINAQVVSGRLVDDALALEIDEALHEADRRAREECVKWHERRACDLETVGKRKMQSGNMVFHPGVQWHRQCAASIRATIVKESKP